MFHRRFAVRLSLLFAVGATVAGCWGSYVGYLRIQDSELWVPPSKLAEIESQALSRDEVIEILGEPESTRADGRAIGYFHCTEARGGIKYYLGAYVDHPNPHCQMIGVWFDDTDRAIRTRSVENVSDNFSPGCALEHALKKSWGWCWW